jgi:uncharacterized protein YlzI (FlbEa/FlbD family)
MNFETLGEIADLKLTIADICAIKGLCDMIILMQRNNNMVVHKNVEDLSAKVDDFFNKLRRT